MVSSEQSDKFFEFRFQIFRIPPPPITKIIPTPLGYKTYSTGTKTMYIKDL